MIGCRVEPGLDLLDRGEECVVLAFDVADGESRVGQEGGDLGDGAGVGEAGDPAGEAAQLRVEPFGVEPHVGEAEAAACRRTRASSAAAARLSGECRQRAFADDGVDAAVAKGGVAQRRRPWPCTPRWWRSGRSGSRKRRSPRSATRCSAHRTTSSR